MPTNLEETQRDGSISPVAAAGPVLVTGAAGFAGSHLLEHLTGHVELVAWSRTAPATDLSTLARWDIVNLLDRDRVAAAIRHLAPTAVYHCAGVPHVAQSWNHTTASLAGNALTTHHLLDAIRRSGITCRVLIPGSATLYRPGDAPIREDGMLAPSSPYALSKLAQEQFGARAVANDDLDVVLTRSFNHTGPRQTSAFVAPSLARQIARIERGLDPPVIKVGNLSARRDLTDVRDVVRAYAAVMRAGARGEVYNVASGVGRTIRAVLDALIARARVPVTVEIDAARLRDHDTPALVGDATRLRERTGWAPRISFDQMLDDLLEYWRAHTEIE